MGLAEPAPRAFEQPRLSTPRLVANPWIILAVLALGEFMILLDTTIVAVAIPNLATKLNASFDQLLWILNIYTVVFAILLIMAGRLGDLFGPKKLFLAGLAIFTVASGACGLAQSPNQLIAFRAVQGAGGAILMPQTLSIITSIFPPQKRGAAFGVWSAIAGLAAVVGPTLGGVLTTAFSWRAVFFPNVPMGVAALILAFLVMPELTGHQRRRVDLVGMLLAMGGLGGLIFGLVENQKFRGGRISDVGAFNIGSARLGLISIPVIIVVSLALLVAFVVWETKQEEPLLPLSLFRNRNFSIGNAVAAIIYFGILGLMLPTTLFLQSVLGFSAVKAGLVLLPNALATMIAAPISGRLTDRMNGKYLLAVGLALFACGLALLSALLSLSASAFTFIPPLALTGLGMGFTLAPMTALTMRDIVPSAAGAASGFLNTIRQVGAALGAGLVGAVLATRLANLAHDRALSDAKQLPTAYRDTFIQKVDDFAHNGLNVGAEQAKITVPANLPSNLTHIWNNLGTSIFNHAFLDAARVALFVPVPLLAIGVVLAFRMRLRPVRPVPALAPAAAPVSAVAPALEPPVRVRAPVYVSDTVVMPVLRSSAAVLASAGGRLRPPSLVAVGDGNREYHLRGTLTIGRLSSNDIVLQDPKVSRSHAVVTKQDGRAIIRDLNSANGTQVNGQTIVGDQPLHPGDTVTVGNMSFIYHDDLTRARPRLVPAGSGGQPEYFITRTLGIGRGSDNAIVIRDPQASRRHAFVAIQDGVAMVRDLESLNGTRVNGQLVYGDQILHDGDTISIGDTSFVYHNDLERG